jgi:imidazoleglycerol-phosphate dehydratase
MPETELQQDGQLLARLEVEGAGAGSVATGLPVLDHLITLLARYASFDLSLEVAPGAGREQVAAAGRAIGETLHGALRTGGARGYGFGAVPAQEALASVAIDASEAALVVSNVDLSGVHVGGLESDLVAGFLDELAAGAGLTIHVRLVQGDDEQHVLDAIFKALGSALREACERPPRRKKRTGR